MYFNGFTLFLMILSMVGGIVLGVKIEEAHQERQRDINDLDRQLLGRTIEDQMKRDGWSL
jgi:hypothetical protein